MTADALTVTTRTGFKDLVFIMVGQGSTGGDIGSAIIEEVLGRCLGANPAMVSVNVSDAV